MCVEEEEEVWELRERENAIVLRCILIKFTPWCVLSLSLLSTNTFFTLLDKTNEEIFKAEDDI